MNLTLKIWRQKNANSKGEIVEYPISDISPDMSFLEMLDVLNSQLIPAGEEPVAFDHDCREGICGSCSLYINGEAHGPDRRVTTCQLHMRKFKDGDTIFIEPFRANAFPVVKDLVVDRSAFDRIQHAGGFISVNTSGNTQDANATSIRGTATVDWLFKARNDGTFNTGVRTYQREKVATTQWTQEVMRTVLEDAFKSISEIHIRVNEDGTYELTDGQQRTSAPLDYMNNEFP